VHFSDVDEMQFKVKI